jgi:hypothetical protein
MIDDLVLLVPAPEGGGKVAYQGPARLAMGWFNALGYFPDENAAVKVGALIGPYLIHI